MMGLATGGADTVRQRHKGKVSQFEGTIEVETSDTFAASTNAVADPSNLLYLQVGQTSNNGASVTLSSSYLIRGRLRVRYFDAIQQ
jgi:hypothetical protein